MIAGFSFVAAAINNVTNAQSSVIPCSSQETVVARVSYLDNSARRSR